MTDDIPELPQFSRNVAVLSERLLGDERDTNVGDTGVLSPFSGILDVTLERGQVPMLDLSYLTLEPLVASKLMRSPGKHSDQRSMSPPTDDAIAEPTDIDNGEPTVREVIHGDSEGQLERRALDLQQLALRDEGPLRTRVDLGPARRENRSGQSSWPSRDAPDDTDSSFDAADFTTGDDSRLAEQITRRNPGDSNRSDRTSTGSTASAPNQTVVDRSGPSLEGGDDSTDISSSPDEPRSTGASEIVPPRMVADRAVGDTGRSSGRTGRRGGERSAEGGPDGSEAEANGPRMVVERREDGSAGSDEANAARNSDGKRDAVGRDPSERTATGDDPIGAVIEASTNPESRFVDHLYRALQERESIERRRRGGR